jgi:hypothetical protein
MLRGRFYPKFRQPLLRSMLAGGTICLQIELPPYLVGYSTIYTSLSIPPPLHLTPLRFVGSS